MRSFRLPLQFLCVVILFAFNAVGCHTMGGYAANSSGMGYYEQGNYTAAATEFQQAMLANPSNPDYVANYAKARMKLGDAQGAEQLYRQALSIAPSHQPAYHGLAETMIAEGRSEQAASLLTTWAATQPYVPESHIELAWIQREMGQTDAAAQSLQKALQLNPNHSTALAHLGQYYEETGHPDQAVAIYQRSLQSDWNQPEVHSRMAAASQSAGSASPMAATAMARGVHPYNVARQQTAFGAPSQGAQVAQMRMAQTQLAMGGANMNINPMYGSAGQMYGGQMAAAPGMNQGMMSTYYSPENIPSFGTNSMHSQGQPAGPMMQMPPNQTASMSFGAGSTGGAEFQSESSGMMPAEGEWSFEDGSPVGAPVSVPANDAPKTAVAPTPDPAFSAAETPDRVTNVSWSATESTVPISGPPATGTPVVEAF